jgi:hypothetical protein
VTLPLNDLQRYCRDGATKQVLVDLRDRELIARSTPWLIGGAACLMPSDNRQRPNEWRLEARLGAGPGMKGMTTDYEHDSAYAFVLPLIGLEVEMVRENRLFATAWIEPDCATSIHVPVVGWDPYADGSGATPCPRCEKNGEEPHLMVEQYIPPSPAVAMDRALQQDATLDELTGVYNEVRGRRVSIVLKDMIEDDEE